MSSRTPATMMLGEVPTRVTIPPAMAPKAIGISRRDGGVPVLRLTDRATGSMMARAPTFLVTIDSMVTARVSTGVWLFSVFSRGSSRRSASSTMPEREKAAETTRAAAMIVRKWFY